MEIWPIENLYDEAFFALIRQLNPQMDRALFESCLGNILKLEPNYRVVGLYDNGKLIAATGYWIGARFYSGVYLQMDNFVVDQTLRNSGIGNTLLAWIEQEAERHHCEKIILDSYVENAVSHKFYFKHGFKIAGFHFNKRTNKEASSPESA